LAVCRGSSSSVVEVNPPPQLD